MLNAFIRKLVDAGAPKGELHKALERMAEEGMSQEDIAARHEALDAYVSSLRRAETPPEANVPPLPEHPVVDAPPVVDTPPETRGDEGLGEAPGEFGGVTTEEMVEESKSKKKSKKSDK